MTQRKKKSRRYAADRKLPLRCNQDALASLRKPASDLGDYRAIYDAACVSVSSNQPDSGLLGTAHSRLGELEGILKSMLLLDRQMASLGEAGPSLGSLVNSKAQASRQLERIHEAIETELDDRRLWDGTKTLEDFFCSDWGLRVHGAVTVYLNIGPQIDDASDAMLAAIMEMSSIIDETGLDADEMDELAVGRGLDEMVKPLVSDAISDHEAEHDVDCLSPLNRGKISYSDKVSLHEQRTKRSKSRR